MDMLGIRKCDTTGDTDNGEVIPGLKFRLTFRA